MSHLLSIKIRVIQSNLVNLKSGGGGTRDLFDTSPKLYFECIFMLLMNQDYFSVMLNDISVYTTCLDDHENFFFINLPTRFSTCCECSIRTVSLRRFF